MTDQPLKDQEKPPEETAPPAEALKPVTEQSQKEKEHEESVSYWRFDEVNKRAQEAEAELAKLRQADEARKRKEQEEQGQFQEIIKDLEPKAQRAQELEAVVAEHLEIEMQGIPEQFRGLIPEGDVATRLQWVLGAKASGLFSAPRAPETDAGVQGDSPKTAKLSADEVEFARNMGLSAAEYARMKSESPQMKDIKHG